MKKRLLAILLAGAMLSLPLNVSAESTSGNRTLAGLKEKIEAASNKKKTEEKADISTEEAAEVAPETQTEASEETATELSADLVVESKNVFLVPDSDTGYFFAKVVNHGDIPLSADDAKLVIYSDTDEILVSEDYALPSPYGALINPGESAYVCEYLYDDLLVNARVGDVKYSLVPLEDGLETIRIPAEATFEKNGPYDSWVNITFSYEGEEALEGIRLVTAMFDAEGNIIHVVEGFYDELTIYPGSKLTVRSYIDSFIMEYIEENGIHVETIDPIVVHVCG